MGQLLGADERTFYGLAGVGDAFGTCLGPLSRNRWLLLSFLFSLSLSLYFFSYSNNHSRKVGFRLAKGERLEEILRSLDGVSEGVTTVLALEQLLKTKVRENVYDFKYPIVSGVAKIVKGIHTPAFGLEALMKYPLYAENVYFTK